MWYGARWIVRDGELPSAGPRERAGARGVARGKAVETGLRFPNERGGDGLWPRSSKHRVVPGSTDQTHHGMQRWFQGFLTERDGDLAFATWQSDRISAHERRKLFARI